MISQNDYDTRQALRAERMRAIAERARTRSEQYYKSARSIADHIPFGQPILVGHHSERGHRRDLDRIHNYYGKSFEEQNKAAYYERRADAAESNSAISSDNPGAVDLLEKKLDGLIKNQECMKSANKIIRKGKSAETIAALVDLGFKPELAEKLFTPDYCGRVGFAAYSLQNNNANIARIRERIKHLKEARAIETTETADDKTGIRIVNNTDENRLQVFFPGIPSVDIRQRLKSGGFHWSRFNGCWQRMPNAWALHTAEEVIKMAAAA